jgi:hypothetical protein
MARPNGTSDGQAGSQARHCRQNDIMFSKA